jgi:hypothetical protein
LNIYAIELDRNGCLTEKSIRVGLCKSTCFYGKALFSGWELGMTRFSKQK